MWHGPCEAVKGEGCPNKRGSHASGHITRHYIAAIPVNRSSTCPGAMTCFPPVCRPLSRYVRGLFKRAKRHHRAPEPCPASTSKPESSMTELPTGVSVAEKEPPSAIDVHRYAVHIASSCIPSCLTVAQSFTVTRLSFLLGHWPFRNGAFPTGVEWAILILWVHICDDLEPDSKLDGCGMSVVQALALDQNRQHASGRHLRHCRLPFQFW